MFLIKNFAGPIKLGLWDLLFLLAIFGAGLLVVLTPAIILIRKSMKDSERSHKIMQSNSTNTNKAAGSEPQKGSKELSDFYRKRSHRHLLLAGIFIYLVINWTTVTRMPRDIWNFLAGVF